MSSRKHSFYKICLTGTIDFCTQHWESWNILERITSKVIQSISRTSALSVCIYKSYVENYMKSTKIFEIYRKIAKETCVDWGSDYFQLVDLTSNTYFLV